MGESKDKNSWGGWIWLIVLAICVFPPVGIALVWRNDKLSYQTQVALTIVAVAVFVGIMAVGHSYGLLTSG